MRDVQYYKKRVSELIDLMSQNVAGAVERGEVSQEQGIRILQGIRDDIAKELP
jgi:hypothetical protein